MKNKILLLIAILSQIFMACDEFLEEENRSAITAGDYFVTADDAQNTINNLYNVGLPTFYNAPNPYHGTVINYGGWMAGLFDCQEKGTREYIQAFQQLSLDPVNHGSDILPIWSSCYDAIAQANTAIKYIPQISDLSTADANTLLAEAKFFRALNYFHLVKMFGQVPLITEPYESLDDIFLPKSPESDIYELIVGDLESALAEGGLANVPMTANGFRISNGSISALLADVYLNRSGYPLQEDHYAEAATIATSLINNGNYALIENGPTPEESTYNVIRTSDNESEYLYIVEYLGGIKSAGWRPTFSFPSVAATWGEFGFSIFSNAYFPVDDFLAVYDSVNDLRAQEKQFFHTTFVRTKGENAGETVHFDLSPYFWYEEEALYAGTNAGKDISHYRLAEMYLIAAEAIANVSGVTPEAVNYLATIQARASLNKTKEQLAAELLGLSTEEFIQEVWREKMREFVFENKIWYDITRTRMYPEASGGEITFVPLVGATNHWGATFTGKNLLMPIPDTEIQRNPELVQNPDY